MNVAVLANSKLAIPALYFLLQNKLVNAVGIPDTIHEATDQIKTIAAQFHTPCQVLSKNNLRQTMENWLRVSKPDVVFVLTFPYKIPSSLLGIPPKGFYNFHFGILPEYRGADAIFWQIKNRESFGGLSVHKMDESFDTGPIIHIEKIPILKEDTYGMHVAKLSHMAVPVVANITEQIKNNTYTQTGQDKNKARYYPKPVFNDLEIQWATQGAEDIIALMRAANPWNKGVFTSINHMPLRIADAELIHSFTYAGNPVGGEVLRADTAQGIYVATHDHKILSLSIIALDEGFYTGKQFSALGIKPGMRFEKIQQQQPNN